MKLRPFFPSDAEDILNSFDYPIHYFQQTSLPPNQDRFTLKDYNKVIKTLLDAFYPGYDYSNPSDRRFKKKEDKVKGAVVFVNPLMSRKWNINCKLIEFNSLYPNSILELYDTDRIEFNIREFGELFKILCDVRRNYKKTISERNYLFLKVLINYTYGVLHYNGNDEDRFLACSDPFLISSYSQDLFRSLITMESKNIIYVDTDQIYLYEINDRIKLFLKYFDNAGIPYEIEDIPQFMTIDPKKYIRIEKDGSLYSVGIKNYKYGR